MGFFCLGITEQCSSGIHNNQDQYGAVRVLDINGEEIAVAVVADGISCGFDGKYASYNTVLWLLQWAETYFRHNAFDVDSIAQEIQDQMQLYNQKLNIFSEQHSKEDTCCTVCGIVTNGNEILIFNAGDSRIYEINESDANIYCLTKDDIAQDGHSIAMHIGGKEDGDVILTFSRRKFRFDSIYFLCTDGMYRKLDFSAWCNRMFDAQINKSDWNRVFVEMLKSVRNLGEDDDVTALILVGCDNNG